MWDWVEIDMFTNMADLVNTSLGVHLFENLQALKAGAKTFKRLAVLYRLHPSNWTESFNFPPHLCLFLSNSRAAFSSLSLSVPSLPRCISLTRSYSKPCLLRDGRLKATVVKWEKECLHQSTVFPVAQNMYPLHYISILCQGLSLALQDNHWRGGWGGQQERWELLHGVELRWRWEILLGLFTF